MKKLISLFDSTRYALADVRLALQDALKAHEKLKVLNDGGEVPPRTESRVPFNGTYEASIAAFEFTQERVMMPHAPFSGFSNKAMLGKDRQRIGGDSYLYFLLILNLTQNCRAKRARALDCGLALPSQSLYRR